jgi:predicted ester cyclase
MKKAFLILQTRQKFIACMALTLLMSLFAYAQTPDTAGEQNKEVIRKYQEWVNSGDTKGAVEYISDEIMNFGRIVGKKGIELVLNDVFATFPDWRQETLEMVAIEDAVILRQKVTGTHLGMGKHRVNFLQNANYYYE